jgi:predicted nucleic acid-binding protein
VNKGSRSWKRWTLNRYRVSFWEALVLQAAQASVAEILYSEDLSHGQRYGPVRVENPFVTQ